MVQYKMDIALGHILTIAITMMGGLGAYYFFVTETQTNIATLKQSVEMNTLAITEIKSTLKTLPTQDQVNFLQDDIREIKADIGWLVRREVEKNNVH